MGEAVELPDFIDDVGVDDVGAAVFVSCEMELDNAVGRNAADVFGGIPSVIAGADEDVVDVEEDAAVCFFGHSCEEVPVVDGGGLELEIGAGVFENEGGVPGNPARS